jgi:hypothetical protein
MLRRLDGEESRPHAPQPHAGAIVPEAAVPVIGESEAETSLLPRDHPKWARDAVTVSQRAREIIARLGPVAIKIRSFWDHRVRSVFIDGHRVCVDPSGSYRVES